MDDTEANLFEALEKHIMQQYTPSRERSLALTKLEETWLWLTRAERASEGDLNEIL